MIELRAFQPGDEPALRRVFESAIHGTARRDRLDVGRGSALIAGDGRGLGDVEDVELMVRDAAALFDRQLGGADVHAAIELHRVGVDDFRPALTAKSLRDVEGQLRLAGAGGADDRQGAHGERHGCQAPAK